MTWIEDGITILVNGPPPFPECIEYCSRYNIINGPRIAKKQTQLLGQNGFLFEISHKSMASSRGNHIAEDYENQSTRIKKDSCKILTKYVIDDALSTKDDGTEEERRLP